MRASVLALALTSCCFAPIELPAIASNEPPTELGTAVFPAGTPASEARRYVCSAALAPSRYAAGYALAAGEQSSNRAAYLAWTRSIGYREIGEGAFQLRAGRGCTNGLACAQRFLGTRERADLLPLANLFLERARAAGWNALDLAVIILAFVQEIEYRVPEGEPFGVIGPASVVAGGWGDCDSKSVLAVVLLQEVGIDAVLLESQAHRHGAVGIAVPATGASVTFEGTRYAYGETTVRGWPIGRAPPEMLGPPNDWTVERIPRQEASSTTGAPERRRHQRSR